MGDSVASFGEQKRLQIWAGGVLRAYLKTYFLLQQINFGCS